MPHGNLWKPFNPVARLIRPVVRGFSTGFQTKPKPFFLVCYDRCKQLNEPIKNQTNACGVRKTSACEAWLVWHEVFFFFNQSQRVKAKPKTNKNYFRHPIENRSLYKRTSLSLKMLLHCKIFVFFQSLSRRRVAPQISPVLMEIALTHD